MRSEYITAKKVKRKSYFHDIGVDGWIIPNKYLGVKLFNSFS
jgi:hypothetical protein